MKFLQKKINKLKLLYLFILLAFFSVFIVLAYINIQIKKELAEVDVFINPLSFTPAKYPEVSNYYVPQISAQGAVVIDKNSQVILFSKNSSFRFPPASTTKIMSAIVALEAFSQTDILTIQEPNVEGAYFNLQKGEQFTFEDLFYAMLLPSSNEAALAIAQNYPEGEEAFVVEMNKKAKEYHLTSSYYAEPIGLSDEKDYTSPIDLARLSAIALENPFFAKTVSTKNKIITNTSGKSYSLFNLNKLLNVPGITGIKTGTTEGAGEVLVTSRRIESENQDLIIVVMQSQDRYLDTQILLDYLNGVNYLSIRP